MDVKTETTPDQIETRKRQTRWMKRTVERKDRRRKQRARRGKGL